MGSVAGRNHDDDDKSSQPRHEDQRAVGHFYLASPGNAASACAACFA
jgi:hypothetical protein